MFKYIQELDELLISVFDDNTEFTCHGRTFCTCNARCACNTQRIFVEDSLNEQIHNISNRAV
ncbi:hypothetical protein KQI86_03920 [Clostridium sp. MSJ-11]|uniref:Bacteriocin n=1 Tax=Clostridium mobile TaxID=2841512 RepID=A0ABS6EEJ6_9CLOT|nr:hypothetical protein [Clostridium mobile]MBU5483463.1 hypothetical protein [Clostridium mobile]